MQQIIIAGRVGKDSELYNTASGSTVLGFSVASDQNNHNAEKSTNWFRCSLWGSRGEKLQQWLKQGKQVTVCGELRIGDYKGKPSYEINVGDVALQGGSGGDGNQKSDEQKQATVGGNVTGAKSPPSFQDELDDDVPF